MATFLNPWMLLGIALIAIPIAIHLLNKSRFKVEQWGAMMFLRKAVQVRAQRIRLEQVFLLILRALLLILFVMALARPVSNVGQGSPEDPTTHVVVFDGSYSMDQGGGQDKAFAKARESALGVVRKMRDGDNMLVLMAGNRPRLVFAKPSFDKSFLRDKISSLEAGSDQTMDLPKTLEHVYWLLEQSSLPRHRIYLLTDGQKHGWRSDEKERWERVAQHLGLQKIKPSLYVLEQTPDDPMRNAAILRVYPRAPIVDIFRPAKFLVEIAHYAKRKETIHVEFFVDGEFSGERDVECEPGVSTIDFDHSFTPVEGSDKWKSEGKVSWHHVVVQLEEDDLPADSTFSLAVEVRHAIPVLVIEGRDSDDVLDSEGGLLSLALTSANEPGKQGLFEVTRRKLYELQDETHALDRYKTVVLANVPSLSRSFQFALEQFVEQGGGLLVALGDQVDPAKYNHMSDNGRGLIPATLEKTRRYEQRPFRPTFRADVGRDILNIFDASRTRVLSEVRVDRFWDSKAAEDALTLAVFDDAPFLVYRHYGDGRVALWTTSANMKWTNFPVTQDYLPLLQNLVTYLSGSIQPPINLRQGEALVYSTPIQTTKPTPATLPTESSEEETTADKGMIDILDPAGREHKVPGRRLGSRWAVEWEETLLPGIYTVRAPNAPVKYYAVALRPGEGDLSSLPRAARQAMSRQVVDDFVQTEAALDDAIVTEEGAAEWWRKLVFVALFLLCGELYLGWRFNG